MTAEYPENIFDILQYLEKIEEGSSEKPQIWNHGECDINLTHFEYLSNLELIGFKSKLKGYHIHVLMDMFQCLFDHNHTRIEEVLETWGENDDDVDEGNYDDFGEALFFQYVKHHNYENDDEGENGPMDQGKVKIIYTYGLLRSLL
jgi:hypothetical protein